MVGLVDDVTEREKIEEVLFVNSVYSGSARLSECLDYQMPESADSFPAPFTVPSPVKFQIIQQFLYLHKGLI